MAGTVHCPPPHSLPSSFITRSWFYVQWLRAQLQVTSPSSPCAHMTESFPMRCNERVLWDFWGGCIKKGECCCLTWMELQQSSFFKKNLKYSWFTMFQVYSKVIQFYISISEYVYIYIHTYSHILFQILFHYRLLQDIPNSSLPLFPLWWPYVCFFMSVSLFLFCK